ncbi:amino acid transporter AVT1C [Trifolium repens]|nr:amino acid transporter AVT1C [Trifolium repens]
MLIPDNSIPLHFVKKHATIVLLEKRQSIDLYGSVPSQNIGFLGTTSLTRLGRSFLGSTLTRRHTAEIIPPIKKPLIQPTVDEEQQQDSSQTLLPPLPSRKSSIRKSSKISHEVHIPGQCSFGQVFPLSFYNNVSIIFLLSGLLLCYCFDSKPGLKTYPDIGQAAFDTLGRVAISIILYMELYSIQYIILESDNLSSLFPDASLNLGGFKLNVHILFAGSNCMYLDWRMRCTGCPFDHSIPFLQSQEMFPW